MIKIILWVDDLRNPYEFIHTSDEEKVVWCKSVNDAIFAYTLYGSNLEDKDVRLTEINLDHDAGEYAKDGGDYIKFLDWMEMCHQNDFNKIRWKIHSMNPVGINNIKNILRRNGVTC